MNGRPKSEPDADLTERITITIPRSILAAIDKAGTNRSATITHLLSMLLSLRTRGTKSRKVKK